MTKGRQSFEGMESYETGYKKGYDDGYDKGYEKGMEDCLKINFKFLVEAIQNNNKED